MSQPRKDSWCKRNWTWAVPIMCVLILKLVEPIATTIACKRKAPGLYERAVAKARASTVLKSLLGEPMKVGRFIDGSVSSWSAYLSIPISGPNGKATIRVVASEFADVWNVDFLYASVNGSTNSIELIDRNESRSDFLSEKVPDKHRIEAGP